MKRAIYLFAVIAMVFVSCNKDDHNFNNTEQNLELRAKTLGYSDINSYQDSVAIQCASGIHENCDIQTDGTHNVCGYVNHSGTRHDGSHHNGSNHGTNNSNGHSHNSHGSGKHH